MLTLDELPEPIAHVLGPWVAELARGEDADPRLLREVAEVAPQQVRDLIALTPLIETDLIEARAVSLRFADGLDGSRVLAIPLALNTARAALDRLIGILRTARPSERQAALGRGW